MPMHGMVVLRRLSLRMNAQGQQPVKNIPTFLGPKVENWKPRKNTCMVLTQQKLDIYSSLWQFQVGKLYEILTNIIKLRDLGGLFWTTPNGMLDRDSWLTLQLRICRYGEICQNLGSPKISWIDVGHFGVASILVLFFWDTMDFLSSIRPLKMLGLAVSLWNPQNPQRNPGFHGLFPHFFPEDTSGTSGLSFFFQALKLPIIQCRSMFPHFFLDTHGDLVNLRACRTPETPAAPAEKKTPRRKQSDWQMQERVKELEAKNLGAWGMWLAHHIVWLQKIFVDICWWFVNWHIVYFWWTTWDDKCWHGVRVTAKLPNIRRS